MEADRPSYQQFIKKICLILGSFHTNPNYIVKLENSVYYKAFHPNEKMDLYLYDGRSLGIRTIYEKDVYLPGVEYKTEVLKEVCEVFGIDVQLYRRLYFNVVQSDFLADRSENMYFYELRLTSLKKLYEAIYDL